MKKNNQIKLVDHLAEVSCPILMDGAMGTYSPANRSLADACEESNLRAPALIKSIQRLFRGWQQNIANNTYAWRIYGALRSSQTEAMIRSASAVATEAVDEYVAERLAGVDSIPPQTAKSFYILADLGYLPEGFDEQIYKEFCYTIDLWIELGATHFICETLQDDRHLLEVVSYIKEKLPNSCIMASFAIPQTA